MNNKQDDTLTLFYRYLIRGQLRLIDLEKAVIFALYAFERMHVLTSNYKSIWDIICANFGLHTYTYDDSKYTLDLNSKRRLAELIYDYLMNDFGKNFKTFGLEEDRRKYPKWEKNFYSN